LLFLHWHLCCIAFLSFHHAGWLLPVACLHCWHLCRASLFWLIVVLTAHCYGGTADDKAVAFAANAVTPAVTVAIAATAVTIAVAPAATLPPTPPQPPLPPFLPLLL
jgi:hypothetical protein